MEIKLNKVEEIIKKHFGKDGSQGLIKSLYVVLVQTKTEHETREKLNSLLNWYAQLFRREYPHYLEKLEDTISEIYNHCLDNQPR